MTSRSFDKFGSAISWIGRHEFLLMLLWSLWLAFPYFGFGSHSYVRLHDCGDCPLPLAMVQASWITRCHFWLWNSLPICGLDSLSSGYVPLKFDVISFALFPPWLAYALVMWLQRFVAGYFTFRLAKDVLRVSQWPALFAGLFYALFSQEWLNGAWSGFTLYDLLLLPAVPFVLWILTRMDPEKWRSYVVAVLLGALLSICSNYKYVFFFFPLIGYWFLVITPRREPRFWVMVFCLGTGYMILEAPVLLATYLFAPFSHRAQWSHVGTEIFIPQLMGIRFFAYQVLQLVGDNILALILLGVTFSIHRRLPKQVSSLVKVSICILGFQLVWLFVLPTVQGWLGFMAGFNFSRFFLFLPFFLTICAAVCLNQIEDSWSLGFLRGSVAQRAWELKSVLVFFGIAVVLIQSCVVQSKVIVEAAEGSNFAGFYRHPALEMLAKKKTEDQPFRVATVVESHRNCPHPAFAWAYDLESVDGYLNIYPRRYQEFWGSVIAPLTAANSRIKSYFWSWGCRVYLFSPGFFSPAAREVQRERPLLFSEHYNLNLLSLGNTKYLVSPIALDDKHLQLIHSPTDEQLAWRSNPSRFDKLMTFLAGKSPGFALYVYENLRSMPRFFFLGKTMVFHDKNALLDALAKADHETLASHAFLLNSDVSTVPLHELGSEKGEVVIRDYSPDSIRVSTRCDSPAILVASNNWAPQWKVWVDGVETPLFPVYHTFQGVYCPSGQHEVVFRYVPLWGSALRTSVTAKAPDSRFVPQKSSL